MQLTLPVSDQELLHVAKTMLCCSLVYNTGSRLAKKVYPKAVFLENHLLAMWVLSSLHAITVCLGAIYGMFVCKEGDCFDDAIRLTVLILMGYTMYDTILLLWTCRVNKRVKEPVFHHIIVLAMSSLYIVVRSHTYYAACYLLNELSTPFLNICLTLKQMIKMTANEPNSEELSERNFWYLSRFGGIFSIIFFLSRVVVNGYVAYQFVFVPELLAGNEYSTVIKVLVVVFWVLQIFWFTKVVRLITRAKGEKKKKN